MGEIGSTEGVSVSEQFLLLLSQSISDRSHVWNNEKVIQILHVSTSSSSCQVQVVDWLQQTASTVLN